MHFPAILRRCGAAAVVALGGALVLFSGPDTAAQINREDLRPGLVGIHRDTKGVEIMQLDAAIALTLKPGEALHPRLAADGGTYRWEGYLNVFRPSEYTFSVLLRGKFKLTLDNKIILSASAPGDSVGLESGAPVKLTAGALPIVAEFTRLPGDARLELFWQSPLFIKEPLAVANLRHLPAKAPKALTTDAVAERGRFWAEELSCTRCHKPAETETVALGLQSREGPDLSRVGERYSLAWIYQWLKNPQHLSPTAVMPRLFGDDETSQAELHAAALYLESLGGPFKDEAKEPAKEIVQRGKQLFSSVGCIVCHPGNQDAPLAADSAKLYGAMDPTNPFRDFKLADQRHKTSPEKLAAFLQEPHKIDPKGRMPETRLDAREAQAIAAYLCFGSPSAPLPPLPKLPAGAEILNLGKRAIGARGCGSCHTLNDGVGSLGPVFAKADLSAIKDKTVHDRGCLAADAKLRGSAPAFSQSSLFPAIRQFLTEGTAGAGSASPPHAARVALQRFNCLACHTRDGEGGLSSDLVTELRKYEKVENGEVISPPTLTGVGHKLKTPWFHEVLTAAGRSRPWMGLRMPQFGPVNVQALPEAVMALEGSTADDGVHRATTTAAEIAAGRQLIGKNDGYGCITCHDIAGHANKGTRGPDLALTGQHVRYDWYRRWLESAQRMDPGSKMPSIILDGRVMLDSVLGGNADAQSEAMWAYLSLGPNLPLPEGLAAPKGMVLQVAARPMLLRTFMPGAGTKAIAIGFPGGVSTVFDAMQCRLAYGWKGGFLDASPVWANRGGAPAKLEGEKFWTASPGFPWAPGNKGLPPDFKAQAKDPAFGGALPEGVLFTGEKRLFFDGYKLDGLGIPTFAYRLMADKGKAIAITEQPVPVYTADAIGVERRFEVAHQQGDLWLSVVELPVAPDKLHLLDRAGVETPIDTKALADGLNQDRALLYRNPSARVIAYTVKSAPPGMRWRVIEQNGASHVLLQLQNNGNAPAPIAVRIWSVSRYDPKMANDLLGPLADKN
jgi:cbb3-type cytochrome oxidase cytochrome c subunit